MKSEKEELTKMCMLISLYTDDACSLAGGQPTLQIELLEERIIVLLPILGGLHLQGQLEL